MELGDGRAPRRHGWWTGLTFPDEVVEAIKRFAQGDLIAGVPRLYFGLVEAGLPLPHWSERPDTTDAEETDAEETGPAAEAANGEPAEAGQYEREFDAIACDDGAARDLSIITSQTCDVCEEGNPEQPWLQVAPVRQLPATYDGATLPRYLYRLDPPDLPRGNWVADLRLEVPVEKTFLVRQQPLKAFATEREAIDFANALGRRRDRAALSTPLVTAVSGTIRRRRRNNHRFRRLLRDDVRSVRLRIEQGTRMKPVAVRVHVVACRAPTDEIRRAFAAWEDEARPLCDEASISLFPTGFHSADQMNLDVWDSSIPLDIS